jgi:sugar phosphate isomerase/epimerase
MPQFQVKEKKEEMIDVSKDIVINLLTFADAVAKGSRQVDCFSEVASLGVKKVEVRREWIKDFTSELSEMNGKAEELGLEIYYSIPGVLFKAGKLDRDSLQQIFQEARILGATRVKFAVGEFDANAQSELLDLKEILSEHTILVTVEGDQSPANGRLEPILALMNACRTNNIPVYATFDVGNFVFVGQEPLYNAVKLSSHVRYIHLKDVEMTPQGPKVRRLDGGHINWRAALSLLPKGVPMGIEFPCGQQPGELLLQTIEQIQEANES